MIAGGVPSIQMKPCRLMARHILQAERPFFFFGQAYMGADAWLGLPGLPSSGRILGDSVGSDHSIFRNHYKTFLV
jgi:hypothetical protein